MDLPVLNRAIDNTAMSAYMACPEEFRLAMLEHRRPSSTTPALVFGTSWHKTLEYHYLGEKNETALEAGLRSWKDHGSSDDYRTPARLFLTFKQYLKEFNEVMDRKTTVGWPNKPMVELSVNVQGDAIIWPYAGKIDRAVLEHGLLYSEDHKTTSRLDRNYFAQFENSNQMMGYTYIAKQLFPEQKCVGVRINVAYLTKTKTEFHRRIVTYSPEQLKAWANNYNFWIKRIMLDTLVRLYDDEGAERAEQALLSLPDGFDFTMDTIRAFSGSSFPRHFGDNGCSRKFGMCAYHKVCSVSPHLRQRVLEHDFEINPWNPLEVEDD